jgi:flavin reductase (DIM6/NTAB) family NADH-FMN oxidoreductase RutF
VSAAGPLAEGAAGPDPISLRHAMSAFATGVMVLAVGGDQPHGMTANAFTSVSLEPPLLLVCIGRDTVMHRRLRPYGVFGVSVLGAAQEALGRHFADDSRALDRQFDGVDCVTGLTGVPLLRGAIAHFECRVVRLHDGGDHTIVLGRPVRCHRGAEDEALVFLDGRFGHQGRHRRPVARRPVAVPAVERSSGPS